MTQPASKLPASQSESQAHGRNITKMVIVVVGMFLLSTFFKLFLKLMFWLMKKSELGQNDIFNIITDFTLILRPSLNVAIYAFFNLKFRESFFKLFCSSCQHEKDKIRNFSMIYNREMSTITIDSQS